MEKLKLFVSKIMLIGAILCVVFMLAGGVCFLVMHGHDPVPWHQYMTRPTVPTTYKNIWVDLTTLSAVGVIQIGLLVLLLTQVIRVALTACLFLAARDKFFTVISFFVLLVLLYCAVWRF